MQSGFMSMPGNIILFQVEVNIFLRDNAKMQIHHVNIMEQLMTMQRQQFRLILRDLIIINVLNMAILIL